MSDGLREAVEAALAKVDRTWGGAAMVVKDTVLSILGPPCTNEFCEHDHAAIRALLANPPQDAGERLNTTCGECGAESWTCSGCGVQRDSWDWPTAAAIVADQP